MSLQLKQLLATLHENDSSPFFPSTPSIGLSKQPAVVRQSSLGGVGGFSVGAQEFVPGKPFSGVGNAVPGPVVSAAATTQLADALGGNNSTLKADAPEFVPSWGKAAVTNPATAVAGSSTSTSVLPNPTTVGSAPSPNIKVIDKKVWFYRDPNGIVRGPFSTTEMRAWADKGYFTGGLEIALSERGPYLPLSAVYPTPERPFWKSIEPREFANRMRQHVVASSRTIAAASEVH